MKSNFCIKTTFVFSMILFGVLSLQAQPVNQEEEVINWKNVWIPNVSISVGYQNQHRVNGQDLIKEYNKESPVITQDITFEWWNKQVFFEFSGLKSLDEDKWAKDVYFYNDISDVDEEVFSSYELRLGVNLEKIINDNISINGGVLFSHYAKAYSNFKEYVIDDHMCTMSTSYLPEDELGLFFTISQLLSNENIKWLSITPSIGIEWREEGRILAQFGFSHTLKYDIIKDALNLNESKFLEKFKILSNLSFFFYNHDYWKYTEEYHNGEIYIWTVPGKLKNGSKAGFGLATLKQSLNYEISDHINFELYYCVSNKLSNLLDSKTQNTFDNTEKPFFGRQFINDDNWDFYWGAKMAFSF